MPISKETETIPFGRTTSRKHKYCRFSGFSNRYENELCLTHCICRKKLFYFSRMFYKLQKMSTRKQLSKICKTNDAMRFFSTELTTIQQGRN